MPDREGGGDADGTPTSPHHPWRRGPAGTGARDPRTIESCNGDLGPGLCVSHPTLNEGPRTSGDPFPFLCSCGRRIFSEGMLQKHRCGDPRPASLHFTSPPPLPLGPPDPARAKALSLFLAGPAWCAVCGLVVAGRPNHSLPTGEKILLCWRCLPLAERVIQRRTARTVEDLRAAIRRPSP